MKLYTYEYIIRIPRTIAEADYSRYVNNQVVKFRDALTGILPNSKHSLEYIDEQTRRITYHGTTAQKNEIKEKVGKKKEEDPVVEIAPVTRASAKAKAKRKAA